MPFALNGAPLDPQISLYAIRQKRRVTGGIALSSWHTFLNGRAAQNAPAAPYKVGDMLALLQVGAGGFAGQTAPTGWTRIISQTGLHRYVFVRVADGGPNDTFLMNAQTGISWGMAQMCSFPVTNSGIGAFFSGTNKCGSAGSAEYPPMGASASDTENAVFSVIARISDATDRDYGPADAPYTEIDENHFNNCNVVWAVYLSALKDAIVSTPANEFPASSAGRYAMTARVYTA